MTTYSFFPDKKLPEQPLIACAGGCGERRTEQEAEQQGWERLPITGRMRCGKCTRELEVVGKLGA